MSRRTPAAGGFFLMAAILIGFLWGMWQGAALLGAMIGTLVGVAIALVTWLADRRR